MKHVDADQQREDGGDDHDAGLSEQEHDPAVVAVDQDAGRERDQEQGNAADEAGEADEEGRVGHLEGQPADGDLVHPEGGVGAERPDQEQPEGRVGIDGMKHPLPAGREGFGGRCLG